MVQPGTMASSGVSWVLRRKDMQSILVTDGNFTYVAIDDQGHPQAIPQGATAPLTT